MKLNKIISIAAAAMFALTAVTGCGNKKKKSESSSDIVIEEIETTETDDSSSSETSAETFPDYPISYPEIEKKRTGDIYEAEDAKLSMGLVIDGTPLDESEESSENPEEATVAAESGDSSEKDEKKPKYSGGCCVTGFKPDGSSSVTFEVKAPSNQHYDLAFSISSERLVNCRVSLNGTEISKFKTMNDGEFTLITLYGVFLVKGKSEIELRPENGNIKLDYLKLANNTSLSSIRYDAEDNLTNKEAGESAKELMTFLTDNYGEYTITGQYASNEKNEELELIYRTTGKYPAIRFSAMHTSGTSFDSTFKDIDACADWYRKGGIVGLMWYWEAPSKKPSVYAKDTDFKLSEAVTDTELAMLTQEEIRGLYGEGKISEQCYGIMLDIDNMAGQLMSLKNKGVPVLWRPLHESYGDWFWWGASGVDAYKWLWNLMYKRYTEYFELDNLIWVWNGQSESTLVDKDMFDIASLDIYMQPDKDYGSRYEQFLALQKIVGKDKLIALSECSVVPDIDASFRDNAVWSFFGLWYGKYLRNEDGEFSETYTSRDNFIHVYNSDGAITLDELIKLRGGEELIPEYDPAETTQAAKTTAFAADAESTENTETTTTIESE